MSALVDSPPEMLTVGDFFTGFFAALSTLGLTNLSRRGPEFDQALSRAFTDFRNDCAKLGIPVGFRITPHSIHGDSITVRDGIAGAVKRGLIGLDNPTFQKIRLNISAAEGTSILKRMTIDGELYRKLARAFVDTYQVG